MNATDLELIFHYNKFHVTNSPNFSFEGTVSAPAKTLSLGLLIFHVNIRSLNKNFGKLNNFLSQLKKKFSEILLIERWSTDDKDSQFPRNKFSITLQFTNRSK